MPPKKKPIPPRIRERVWSEYIGDDNKTGKCLCCSETIIDKKNFNCGHVKSEKDGGVITVDNLRPICSKCNGSMGTQNMLDYMKIMKYKKTELWNGKTNIEIEKNKIPKLEQQNSQIQLRSFYDQYLKTEKLNLNPSYQRSFCWNFNKQRFFIDTIMKRFPVPNFVICTDKDKKECIDGQNRLHTIINFIEHKKLDEEKYLYYSDDYNMKCYYELTDEETEKLDLETERVFTKEEKEFFNSFVLSLTTIITEIDYKTKQDIFFRLQMGEPPNDAILIKKNENEIMKVCNKLLEINISNKLFYFDKSKNYDNFIFTLINIIKIIDDFGDENSESKIIIRTDKYIFDHVSEYKLNFNEEQIYKKTKEFLEYIQRGKFKRINELFLFVLSGIYGKYNLDTLKVICRRMIDTEKIDDYNKPKKFDKDINDIFKEITKIGVPDSEHEESDIESSDDEKPKKVNKLLNIKDICVTKFKPIECKIDGIQFDDLHYASILKKIFEKINDFDSIKENTSMKMFNGKKTTCGYHYWEKLDMSWQYLDANGTMKEIEIQCVKNNIDLNLTIKKLNVIYNIEIKNSITKIVKK